MTRCVIDTSVVLAYLFQEPGKDLALALFGDALLSSINLAEIATKLASLGRDEAQILADFGRLNIKTLAFTDDLAFTTGLLRSATHHKGLSLGDRACLALALREQLPVYTSDRAWAGLDVGVEIRLLR